jgi:hypothetical protein
MPRIAAPELEDFDWFPAALRDAMTGFLRVASETLGASRAAAPLIREAMDVSGSDRIVDLCSGGGGPVISLSGLLASERDVSVVLTDKFPNHDAFDRAERELPGRLVGRRDSVDATDVPAELTGVRTIFNAFHHLPPEIAVKVLEDAAMKRQPIASFELVERSVQGLAALFGIPLAVLAVMPLVRPRRPLALALTYVVPLLPLLVLWDGFASCLRSYSVEELEAMIEPLQRDDYRFRVERVRLPYSLATMTCLVGVPV